MALIQCPECSGQISDKAIICPHCGFPVRDGSISTSTPRKARKRRPNGSGTVVKLSGKRKNPFQVRVNTRINADGYPAYDVIGCYPDRVSAGIALTEYNKSPYNPNDRIFQTRSKIFTTSLNLSHFSHFFNVPHFGGSPCLCVFQNFALFRVMPP